MPKALLLIDFQNEWIDKNSEYFVGDISDTIKKTNKLIDHCRKQNYKIIFTRHIEPESTKEFAPKSSGVELIKSLKKQPKDTLVTKNKISPFYQTDLDTELQGVKEVVICGILTNLCVRSAVQDAYDRDLDITVIKDCCVSFDQKTQDFTFKDLKATREEINFINLKPFLGL